MKKIYPKIIGRTFRKNVVHVAIIAILSLITIAIVSGIGSLAPRLQSGIDALYAYYSVLFPGFMVPEHITSLTAAIDAVSYVFPVFFIAVTVLVVYISVSRLIDIERSQMGCLRSLGFKNGTIVSKYAIFVGSGATIGSTLGLVVGYVAISPLLFEIIANEFYLLPETTNPFPLFGLITAILLIVFSIGITLLLVLLSLKGAPAQLLRPKAPPKGRKILLERTGPLWRTLPFRYKSSLRNIFRYRVRLFMTVFSMLFSSALVYAAIALSFVLAEYNPDLTSFIFPISALLAGAAVALCVLVIYNITNINIEERKREIATLKVLGYRNLEVTGYVFREIFILGIMGIALGLPAGFGFMVYLIENMGFGSFDYMSSAWYVWLITLATAIGGLLLTDLFLFRKIIKTDMMSSLKSIE